MPCMFRKPEEESGSDPVKEMFLTMFMGPGFFSSESDRLITRKGAEALYEEMTTKGVINLGREDILRVSQKFGDEFFERMDSAPQN